VNEVSAKTFTTGILKKFAFLADHAEVCPETGKLILPLWYTEKSTQELYRKKPKTHKTYITGENSDGFNTLFSSGDFINVVIKDVFTDVDIYKENVRLLHHPFISPISSSQAILFYHYFINDTTFIDGQQCIDVAFTPANAQDFGFTGNLYISTDGEYQVVRSLLNVSSKSGVNFVENLLVQQTFKQLPQGQRTMTLDDMIVELRYLDGTTKLQAQRYTVYSDFDFSPITQEKMFKHPEVETKLAMAEMRDSTFWNNVRPAPLTVTENNIGELITSTKNVGGYGAVMTVLKALLENSIEMTKAPNKFDLMPLNTMISNSYVDGFRLRAGGQTTANFNPHLFLRGYYAYGFKDHRSKFQTEIEYSFNKKKYMAHEFPRQSIMATFGYDTMSPTDQFSNTSKDNFLTSFKTTKVDKMMYVRNADLKFNYETSYFFTTTVDLINTKYTPAGKLFYKRMGTGDYVDHITSSNVKLGFRYAPRESFGCSKQRRIPTNKDATIITLEHTMGVKNLLGADYNYHLTEASFYRRFWLPLGFGSLETYINAGRQWSKVPFPFLLIPASNLSYFTQFDGTSFNMLEEMEFLNDKYLSVILAWNLKGKLFNRIPLFSKLKLREHLGLKVLWGGLDDRNNPYVNTQDDFLFEFPMRDGIPTRVMGSKPYMELSAGISNIFKILSVQYVRRVNYHFDDVNKNGIRFEIKFSY